MNKFLKTTVECLLVTLVLQAGMLGFGIARLWEFNETIRMNRGMDIHDAVYRKLTTKYGIRAKPCSLERAIPVNKEDLMVVGTLLHSVACDVLVTQKMKASSVEELSSLFALQAPRWSQGLQRNGALTAASHRESETALGWPFRYYFWRGGSSDNLQMGIATVVPLPEQEVVIWRLAASIMATIVLSFGLLRIPASIRCFRGYLRNRKGLCRQCSYLIGKDQFKCPECGEPIGERKADSSSGNL